jgi:glycosyltransferase involved in cell wall biosynthesis
MASGAHGGGADHLLGLLPAQAALGITVEAAVGDDGPLRDKLQDAGIACRPLSLMGARLSPGAVLQVRRCLSNGERLVHVHGTRAAFYAGLAVAMAGGPPTARVVYTAHGLAFRQVARGPAYLARLAAEAVACHMADAVISVSATDLATLQARGWLGQRPCAHISNAVDARRFVPADRTAARARLGLDATQRWVGTTSRLVPQKAVADLMQAVLPISGVSLLLVGDGPLRRALEAHPLATAGRVRFLGARDDVADILPALDVFALSSHWEGEPIALLEAMACGLPCVATATPGAAEILATQSLGRLVPIGDVPALNAALATLLADPKLRQQLGANARGAVAARSYAMQAQRTLAVYARLPAGARGS